jgi:molybdate transport system regulatory protein
MPSRKNSLNPEKSLEYSCRLYLDAGGRRVLGKGGAKILEAIDEHGSIAVAVEKLGMSYKFVWNYLTRMRKLLGQPVVVTHRGGSSHMSERGGGGTALTPLAKILLKQYRLTEESVNKSLSKQTINLARIGANELRRKAKTRTAMLRRKAGKRARQ